MLPQGLSCGAPPNPNPNPKHVHSPNRNVLPRGLDGGALRVYS